MSDYNNTYLNRLLDQAGRVLSFSDARIVGEIEPNGARQPHVAVFVELVGAGFIGTTVGLANRPAPLPAVGGFQYFELVAVTERDSPRILGALSTLGNYMLAVSGPAFWSTDDMMSTWGDDGCPDPVPFLPFETIVIGGDGLRFLLVHRWEFVADRPIEVVEPLPITGEQWDALRAIERDQRGTWINDLGLNSRAQWNVLLE